VALSPRANYTDWATATCRQSLVPTFVDRGMSRGQRGGSLTVLNLSFLSSSSSFILAKAEWTPFQTHCYWEKSGSAGNRTRDLCVSSQELWPLDQRGGHFTTKVNFIWNEVSKSSRRFCPQINLQSGTTIESSDSENIRFWKNTNLQYSDLRFRRSHLRLFLVKEIKISIQNI
jgi:hypothetical protein